MPIFFLKQTQNNYTQFNQVRSEYKERANVINQFQLGSQMQSYLQERMASTNLQTSSLDKILSGLKHLQEDNAALQKELFLYEQKISHLPIEMRHKIHHQQYLPSPQQHQVFSNARQTFKQPQQNQQQQQQPQAYSPHTNPFTSIVDKNLLESKLANLQQEQQQINYISRLSDMYIRCQKGQQSKIRADSSRSVEEMQELQEIAHFIEAVRPYGEQSVGEIDEYRMVNELVANIKLHTSKKLTQKCQNLIYYSPSGNNQKIIIQKFLIQNCKSIILGQNFRQNNKDNSDKTSSQKQTQPQKDLKIISKFIQKILSDVIYYDVSYQQIVMMQILPPNPKPQLPSHQQVIIRKKLYFFPSQTQKHFDSIKFTLSYHLQKVNELKSILSPDNSKKFEQMFDKIVQSHVSLIKSNLEYILPYINIKSRKIIMAVLADGKDEVMQFEDLVLRLKFKGQDGEMFMNNLDAVFGRLLQINDKDEENDQQHQAIRFNDKNFQTLTNFFQLGIFQAQQSLLQASSKAIKKLTTNFTVRNNFQKPTSSSSKLTSKKIFNMIFFSVSNLIDRFDELLDKEVSKFGRYSRALARTYEEKANEWVDKLIEIREGVRKRIHEE